MNYLAHAYLSFRNPLLITGNLIADFVKGKKQLAQYDPGIQRGIRLHRAIDVFTDEHPVTAKAKLFFRASSGLYSGVFMDLVYDHFLATDSNRFTEGSLYTFSHEIYQEIANRAPELPPAFLEMFQYMRQYNWLYNYRTLEGMERAFRGITGRARYLQTPAAVIFAAFTEHYNAFREHYQAFFPQLQAHVENLLQMENR
ncbi:MAG TPA: ACP phosphodiesterase [Chitinophaga sp.]|uniref:acyl carrier protein phosphodiesterase n=1 Tax=Chitinophaga sp. TaxID=1869181 RepID=UPI002C8C43F3|nr:ACP phosphodiesterase [Chitinophaga sp.]HVI48865.1 ACP phosphodiesterase [Chitinophaga sp.]